MVRKSTHIILGVLVGTVIGFLIFTSSPMTEEIKYQFSKPYLNLFKSLADSSVFAGPKSLFGELADRAKKEASQNIVSATENQPISNDQPVNLKPVGRANLGTIDLIISIFVDRAPSVLEAGSGSKGILIKLISNDWSVQKRAKANGGQVVFHQIPKGSYRLEIFRPDYQPYKKVLRLTASRKEMIKERVILKPRIRLAAIKGRIDLESIKEKEAKGVELRFYDFKGQLVMVGKTGRDGSFYYDNINPKICAKIVFHREGYQDREYIPNLSLGKIINISLVLRRKKLEPISLVSIRVVDRETGRPVRGAEIAINKMIRLTSRGGLAEYNLSYGQYQVTVNKTGYFIKSLMIEVARARESIDIQLSSIHLDPIPIKR